MKLIKTISELKAFVAENDNISLVPTMGALHLGHGALIKEAGRRWDSCANGTMILRFPIWRKKVSAVLSA